MELRSRRERVDVDTNTARRRIRGSLLAGAVGDALGAPVEFWSLATIRDTFGPDGVTGYPLEGGNPAGAITDDTQMTLFTAEAMIRALVRGEYKGMTDLVSVTYLAYLRWFSTQGGRSPIDHEALSTSGWLVADDRLHHRRAPGTTCLSALGSGRRGEIREPINDSKGCGGVMRVAPCGLIDLADPFDVAARCAALTHGHPSGYLPAGALAVIVDELFRGALLDEAIDAALARLVTYDGQAETLHAIDAARQLAGAGRPTPEAIETLGGGWVGEEALAIALCAALSANDLLDGLLLAVNHSGDTDSTGSIAGNILGALHGYESIPQPLLADLELADVITTVADDLAEAFHGEGVGSEYDPRGEWFERYPGW